MILSVRCRKRLEGVHPDLVRVVEAAAEHSPHDFIITEGLRTKARQAELVKAGASRTMNSRHLTGHAIDYAVKVGTEVRWDWPLYRKMADLFKLVSADLDIAIIAGADWVKFRDGPHIELDRRVYP